MPGDIDVERSATTSKKLAAVTAAAEGGDPGGSNTGPGFEAARSSVLHPAALAGEHSAGVRISAADTVRRRIQGNTRQPGGRRPDSRRPGRGAGARVGWRKCVAGEKNFGRW
jgi:hypothetical protein